VVGDEVLNTLSEYLHRLPSHDVLVAGVFVSDVDAMCWVTNPLSHEVIVNCCASTPASGADGENLSGWYGVVNKLSSAAFDVGRGGLGCALSAVTTAGAELSVVRRFSSLAMTVDWLAASEARDILTVMSTAGGAPATGTLDGEPPLGASCGRDRPATVEASRPALGTHGCASLTTATDCRRTCGQGGRAALPLVAPVGRAASGAPTSGLPPSGGPGAGGGAHVPPADPSLGQDGGEGDCVVKVKVEPAAKVGSSAAPWPEATVKARAPRVGDKRKLDNTKGPPEALNPPQSWSDKAESTFSRSAIHKMMEETRVYYDRVFLEQALKKKHAVAGVSTGHVARKAKSPPGCVRVEDDVIAERVAGPVPVQVTHKTGKPVASCIAACSSTASVRPVPASTAVTTATGHDSPRTIHLGDTLKSLGSSAGTAAQSKRGLVGAALVPAPLKPISDGPRHRRPIALGRMSSMAAAGTWDPLFLEMSAKPCNTFVSGGPGVGKTTFLRRLHAVLRASLTGEGAVVVCAPTGSAAHTAGGQTYHSFFGFGHGYQPVCAVAEEEADRLLRQRKYAPIARRLARVEVLLLDEISMVSADRLDVMVALLRQSRSPSAAACVLYVFGDFLQLRPPKGVLAFKASCWDRLFGGKVLELTRVHRQNEPAFIEAIHDARYGVCSDGVMDLVQARSVLVLEQVDASVMHLLPRHKDVAAHNLKCLNQLCPRDRPLPFAAVDSVQLDRDVDGEPADPEDAQRRLRAVSGAARAAALVDCVASVLVEHCMGARVMYISNAKAALGLFHGSIGTVTKYTPDGIPVVRFLGVSVPKDVRMSQLGIHDASDTWVEVECPPVEFEAKVLSAKGFVAVRTQVPFVLGWAITIHRSQGLTLSEAAVDLAMSFEAGMVLAALSRVDQSNRLFIKSFQPARLFADEEVVRRYLHEWQRV